MSLSQFANDAALCCRLMSVSMRGQMQYRASFLMLVAGTFAISFLEFGAVWIMFDRFGHLRGWSLAEVAVFYGLVNSGFALAEATSRGFEHVPEAIRSGTFDRVLLRPRSIVLQLLGQELQLRRVGRLGQGLLVLGWAWQELGLGFNPARLGLTVLAILGSASLFYALSVLQGMMSFWTTEALEIANCLTHGGNFVGQYPIAIYRDNFRRFFTWIVPLACVTYYPALAIIGHTDAPVSLNSWLAPLAGFAFLAVSLRLWRFGVRHYRSTGS
ncbi:MAG: ABC-2 family transporter protein [bacterium]|nr:ABC-2 family transporter protein [bacterium]